MHTAQALVHPPMAMCEPEAFIPDANLKLIAEMLESLRDIRAKEQLLVVHLQKFMGLPDDASMADEPEGHQSHEGGLSLIQRPRKIPYSSLACNYLFDLAEEHGLDKVQIAWTMNKVLDISSTLSERVPCANVQNQACSKVGKMACAECKLVSYCSRVSYTTIQYSYSVQLDKECQRSHWRQHKQGMSLSLQGVVLLTSHSQDCKGPTRSPDWQPAWIAEGRSPNFNHANSDNKIEKRGRQLALGLNM